MAGIRPSDKSSVSATAPFTFGDCLFVVNGTGDRKIPIDELKRQLNEGTGDSVDSPLTFVSHSELDNELRNENGNFRVHDGKLQIYNVSESAWYDVWFETTQGVPVLKWAPSIDDDNGGL